MNPKECYNVLLVQKLIEEFKKRNIEGVYCETTEAALKKILEMVPKESMVSCGGSAIIRV